MAQHPKGREQKSPPREAVADENEAVGVGDGVGGAQRRLIDGINGHRSIFQRWSAAGPFGNSRFRNRYSVAESSLGRGNLVRRPRIDGNGGAQRARQTFKTGLGNVMVVAAVKRCDMQRYACIGCESTKPFFN